MQMFDEPKAAAVRVPIRAVEKPVKAVAAPEVNSSHSLHISLPKSNARHP